MADRSNKKSATQRFDEEFMREVIDAVKSNTAPWLKSWSKAEIQAPYNAKGTALYSGRNAIRLALQAQKRGYHDPRWATYNQITEMGGTVNKGEKGTGILWYSEKTVTDKDTGESQKIPIVRHYHVFNIAQTNLPTITREDLPDRTPDMQAFADLIAAHNPKISQGEPAYRPSNDTIYLPPKESFHSEAEYYATALHEMSHWTGAETRLNRDLTNPFGSEGYAKEELVAELSSYMLTLEHGLPFTPNQHEAYLQHWAGKTGEELEASMLQGFKDATTAKNYINAPLRERAKETEQKEIIDHDNTLTQEQTPTQTQEPSQTDGRIYIDVPFEEKNEAKQLGAKWDKDAKSWYAPEGVDLKTMEKWIPSQDKSTSPQAANTNEKTKLGDNAFWQTFYREINEKERFDALRPEKPTYLAVSYDDRIEAKKSGAKWDNDNKSWYAKDGQSLESLQKWLPQMQDNAKAGGSIDEFCHAAQSIGLDMSRFSDETNKWHRIPIEGKGSSNKDGAYKLFNNPDGTIGGIARNLSTGEEVSWSNRNPELKIAPEVARANELNRAIHAETMQTVREQIATQRSVEASILYTNLPDATGHEPYLANKGINFKGGLKHLDDGSVVVPLISGERVGDLANERVAITSLQVITPDGDKRLMKQGSKAGSYFPIGSHEARQNPSHVFIAEGLATAESVAQIMRPIHGENILVVAAIDSGNLSHVAEKMQIMYPKAGKTIAADNDIATEQKTGTNPGIKAAEAVKEKYPDFDIVKPIPSRDKNTDWNDALQRDGIKQCIADVLTRNDTRSDRHQTADVITINTDGKCPREIGHAAFDAIGGNINRIDEAKKALSTAGYQFDDRQLKGVQSHPVTLREAFGKAVSKQPEKNTPKQSVHER